ncbi:Glutamyl-tRNA(Gln) amidotransferase subunit A [uncultured Alphaproteobacteria bacterium]|uniref:Glutamyl-tRNA(Gln) amidotransferase subunit A n=1 Tax=uncultured Alphaproteobacteria bacterium TaxID=91750 RepID=A0A212JGD3_9PROT|nr:Glutamyl-tRNA(Gln) amidotransferase subunit A [uncultured Alphaproteobacteria bacterium]
MTELTNLTLAEVRDGLAKGDYTSVELTEAFLGQMDRHKGLNAYIVASPEVALDRARASDARRAKGETLGPMDGAPVAIKDLFCTEGVQTTAASKILEGFKPQYESTVSARLKAGGAVMLGKTNLDEFAMGSANITSAYGNVVSPWVADDDPEKLVPGGSSGGSAAAVSARMCLAATGTDTGGSIRQPAAFTGIVGLKPTYGRCSRWGIVAFASSLDQAGPMTRTVKDAAIMLGQMAGFDPKDSTSAKVDLPDFEKALTGDVRGLKVGIPKEYRPDGLNSEIAALWDQGIAWLKDAGAEIVEISLPHTDKALATYYIVAPAEASSNLARYDGVRYGLRVENGGSLDEMYMKTRAAGFGKEVKRRILIGTYVLSAGYYDAYYLKAQKVRALIADDFAKAFKTVDVILTPTAPSDAFPIAGGAKVDPITMYLNDVFTVPASLAGVPAMSIPGGLSQRGLPLGLQLIGRPFDEETILRAAGVMEAAAEFSAVPTLLRGTK